MKFIMKILRIFFCFFSLWVGKVMGQRMEEGNPLKSSPYSFNGVVGVDVLNTGLSTFSERKLFQGFISTQIKEKIHAIADAGFEKNNFDKNGYQAYAQGFFFKLGTYYMLIQDVEDKLNGFYAGGKIAGSFYKQDYTVIPIRGYGGRVSNSSMPISSQSTYWVEAMVGGRIRIFDTPFFIDVNVQPRYRLYSTLQNGVHPLVIPGFGKGIGKFNMGFSWNVAYYF